MNPSNREELSQGVSALENAKATLTKRIQYYSLGIVVGASMIGASVVFLAYHVAVTWRVENLPKTNNSTIGLFLAVGGSFLYSSFAKKKKAAQVELAVIEQQLPQ